VEENLQLVQSKSISQLPAANKKWGRATKQQGLQHIYDWTGGDAYSVESFFYMRV
jgi:hypothetical protein